MNEIFKNTQIDHSDLPTTDTIEYSGLEKTYLNVSVISNAVLWFFLCIPFVTFILINPFELPSWTRLILIPLFLLFGCFSFYVIWKGFYKKGYALREKDIVYKEGLFWKSQTTVPYSRIQHCEVKQGPIERTFDISSLLIFTAGGNASDLSIPGLEPQDADRLKKFVLDQISNK